MTRVKITSASEVHFVHVSNCDVSADIPNDGKFHKINPDLLGALANSAVEFEIEKPKAKAKAAPKKAAPRKRRAAKRERAPAGAAAGLGGSAAAPSSKS